MSSLTLQYFIYDQVYHCCMMLTGPSKFHMQENMITTRYHHGIIEIMFCFLEDYL